MPRFGRILSILTITFATITLGFTALPASAASAKPNDYGAVATSGACKRQRDLVVEGKPATLVMTPNGPMVILPGGSGEFETCTLPIT